MLLLSVWLDTHKGPGNATTLLVPHEWFTLSYSSTPYSSQDWFWGEKGEQECWRMLNWMGKLDLMSKYSGQKDGASVRATLWHCLILYYWTCQTKEEHELKWKKKQRNIRQRETAEIPFWQESAVIDVNLSRRFSTFLNLKRTHIFDKRPLFEMLLLTFASVKPPNVLDERPLFETALHHL